MKGAQWMDIRVELGREYHMAPRTAKRYAESPQKPEYTLSGPKPTKTEPYKQIVGEWLEEAPYSALRILEKPREMGFDGGIQHRHRGQTKGNVERTVQFVRDNFMVEIQYNSLADLNGQALAWAPRGASLGLPANSPSAARSMAKYTPPPTNSF